MECWNASIHGTRQFMEKLSEHHVACRPGSREEFDLDDWSIALKGVTLDSVRQVVAKCLLF